MVHFNRKCVSELINERVEDLKLVEKGLVLLVSLFTVMQRCRGIFQQEMCF